MITKYKPTVLIAAISLAVCFTACSTEDKDPADGNSIWFDTPSNSDFAAPWKIHDQFYNTNNPDPEWEKNVLPIGNGSLGGAIFGSVGRERVVLNEKTLWTGGPGSGVDEYWNMNRRVDPAVLQEIRDCLKRGDNSRASELTSEYYRGNIDYDRSRFGTYTVMGEAYVATGIDESTVTDYRRVLNLDRSLATVEFNAGPTHYTRRYFCSYPDSVMVWQFSSEGGSQDLTFSFDTPQNITSVTADGSNSLLWQGKVDNNGMLWALKVLVRVEGSGTVKADADKRVINVSGADNVTFLLAGDTDYKMNFDPDITDPKAFVGEDPVHNVDKIIAAADKKSYKQLYADHYADYSSLYDRVSLSINPGHQTPALPTPERLKAYREGAIDPGLEETFFQFGRYLLISSSRAGNMPANLQGIWSNNIDGPWHVDYHNNINLQMNYWPATSTNLTECFVPLVDYVRGIIKPGERTVKAYYGDARGWTAPISTNLFGFTAPLNAGDMSWNYNPPAGPWLASQLWEYYDYTRDSVWLADIAYDIIKSGADFTTDMLYLVDSTYTWAPSYSPEHGQADLGATYANAVAREALTNAIEAATILGRDPESVAQWKERLDNIYPYQVGQYGQLQEWYEDIDQYGDQHRHTNHLFGLHPGRSIDANTDTVLANAIRETLRQRGDAATGWSMGWKLNHWARLHDGDHAYILLRNLLSHGTSDNLWDVHPPFQIDGNFGGTAGIAELFLQSHTGKLHLLPALPSAWTDGSITGLLARGNFEVSIWVKDGRLDHADILSKKGGRCTLLYEGQEIETDTKPGQKFTVAPDATGSLVIR